MHRAEAVGAGVAAADDDDVLAGGGDEAIVRDAVALAAPVLLRQVLHREVHARQLAAGNRQIARLAGAAGEHDGVEVAEQRARRHVHADVRVGPEHDAFRPHQPRAGVRAPSFRA